MPQEKNPVMPGNETLRALADAFHIFGDETRLRLLYRMSDGELCVQQLAQALGMTQSAVSHQLRILKNARLVRSRRAGKSVFYTLDDDHVRSILALGMEHVEEKIPHTNE